ncbi:hypothetical protein KOAAANKH_02561 [Brevundimonas sp. NIBR10]|uniref:hypothetical protein n=1 Tax=Brevundimonas sp. NIBR10 TaxID=3015997 RepID=UPI0022F1957D|nr:hypothetical protein [Brevundimonas sp. NIBR10]WGM47679.1 hypothetical protein KOAAANKH_02561 [Brevundimonas sp. NIBR10]
MVDESQVLQARLRRFLRPRVTAKALARQIDCDPRTAQNILAGHWPSARHWLNIVQAFGKDVTEAVFHPDDAAARLEQEVQALERQLAEKRALAAEVARTTPRPSRAVAASDHRPSR